MANLDLTFCTEIVLRVLPNSDPSTLVKKVITVDLKPNGAMIPVTSVNRLEYIHLMARYRLSVQARLQTQYFVNGLSAIISPRWLAMFNQTELQTLVGGNDSSIDVDDLHNNTLYGGVYVVGDDGQEHPTVRMFWRVMRNFSDNDQKAVIRFVTSVSRAPLLGFSALNPRFSIRDGGGDESRLPSSSTCVNLLKLPRYTSEQVLAEKLLYAVGAGAGFDLS